MTSIFKSLTIFIILFILTLSILFSTDRYGFFHRTTFLYSKVNLYEKINLGIRKNPEIIVLGTSRPFLSFNPNYSQNNIYNGASHVMLPSHYIFATRVLSRKTKVKKFIIFLDFFTANENLKRINNFKLHDCLYDENFFCRYKDLFKLYYNWSNLIDSFDILLSLLKKDNIYLEHNGFLKTSNYNKIYSQMSVQSWFKKVENDYDLRIYHNAKFDFERDSNYLNFLNHLCFLKNKENINITLAIPPIHNRLLKIIKKKNYMKHYNHWKKTLIFMKKKCNIDTYDFTDDSIPDKEFYEVSHIKEDYMNKIQDIIFKNKGDILYKKN
jgi:hypothetical protein